MKTEKEFSDFFVESCQHEAQFDDYVNDVAKNYWSDLTTHLNTYFTNEDRLKITQKAAELLSENLKKVPLDEISSKEARTEAWASAIRNFVQNNYWGFQSTTRKPKIKQTEEQQIFWKIFKYTWAFFQSMIVLKIAVYYFGLESASNPEETSVLWVWFFFSISVGSLAFFAYRNRHDKD